MLFGTPKAKFDLPTQTPPYAPPQNVALPMSGGPAGQPKKPGVNWLGVLADALAGAAGKEGPYAARMMEERQRAAQAADAQRKQAEAFALFKQEHDYRVKNPMPSNAQPHRWEDNAGNVWELGADGNPKRIFTDKVPKYYVQGNRAVQVQNPYATAPQAAAPETIPEALWNSGKPIGGAASGQRGFR